MIPLPLFFVIVTGVCLMPRCALVAVGEIPHQEIERFERFERIRYITPSYPLFLKSYHVYRR